MSGERRVASSEGARRRARKRAAVEARPEGDVLEEARETPEAEAEPEADEARAEAEAEAEIDPKSAASASATAPEVEEELDPEEVRRARVRLLAGAGVVLALVLIYGGVEFGAPAVVLIITGVALILVIAAFWSSVRTLLGESKLSSADAFALGAPNAEEEQKRAVLRALKDLEFERSVGKISDEDYGVLAARYREEAKRLLRAIDKASQDQRQRAEVVVEKKLRKLGLVAAAEGPADDAAQGAPPPPESREPERSDDA